MAAEQKQKLEQQLWNIANTLRGKMDADDFRDYILGFIFYKYLSTKMDLYANTILQPDGLTFQQIVGHPDEALLMQEIKQLAIDKLGFFLEPSDLFTELARRGNAGGKNNFILGDLAKVLTHIEQSTMGSESEEDFGNLFSDLDLTSHKLGKSEADKNELIVKVLVHLDEIDFDLENTESDVLGDAYEYLIGQFASGAGKKAGEFYTPQQVSSILAQLVTVGKDKLKSVYDPTCGSGSLLLRVAKEVKDVSAFYGQEMNPTTYNLCRMNMIMHDVHYKRFDIKNEDTLERPQHYDLRFEAIVANPPFSANWSASPLFMNDERFSAYGKLAPSSKADFAFVQHMIHHLTDDGIMSVILPHGVLYRGNSENQILKFLIKERNYLDAVISLPQNIFYGTSTPTCIMVFKKNRKDLDEIFFIDASDDFEKMPKQNILRNIDVERIINTYKNRKDIDKYSRRVSLSEIETNKFNLNFPRYIDKFKRTTSIDLEFVCNYLNNINEQSLEIEKKIESFCKELKIPCPKGNNIDLLNLFREGIMQKLFEGTIRFKNINGHNFSDWKKMTLGDILTYRPTNSFSRDKLNYSTGFVKNIHYGDIHTKFNSLFDINNEEVPFINGGINLNRIHEDNYCKIGDIIIADASEDYADIGKTIEILNLNNEKVLAGLHTILARPDKLRLQKGFLGFLMKSNNVKLQIMRLAQGSKVLGISSKRISEISVDIPEDKEQRMIVDFLTAIDNKINFNNIHMNSIAEYKKSLQV